MKLSQGLSLIGTRNVEKGISKKILLANTADKAVDKNALKKATGSPADPIYFTNTNTANMVFNPDIRYRYQFAFSPLTNINYRNDLLVFAENNEIKKAVNIMANETVITDSEATKYPVYPKINITQVPQEKQEVALAIQKYLDEVFYPKLFQYYDFKNDGLIKCIKDFIVTGKTAYEIIYDNIKNPKDIVGFIPIDPSSLQKIKEGDYVYYVQKAITDNAKERCLHENQIVLLEFNEYDYGYVSYVDRLRMSFNIMRSMMTSKILWFAAKSQVRMHIKLALGDVTRTEAIQKLTESKNQYINHFSFSDDGQVKFNNSPNNMGYREFFTAETQASGSPEIEEINSNGPDLTEVDSLQYWEKLFWKDTEIPFDRIDPNSSESWGFNDVAALKKIEINFSNIIAGYRKILNQLFLKPIVIQLTLKEIEIGIDLSLLDSIKMEWVAFNEYTKLAELEVLGKKIELATQIAEFGKMTDVDGTERSAIPITWLMKNFLDFTEEQFDSMEQERLKEQKKLGFILDAEGNGVPAETEEDGEETVVDEEETSTEETADDIKNIEDEQY